MSRLTREDFAEMRRCNERPGVPLSVKQQQHLELERQIAEFLANGGAIQRINIEDAQSEPQKTFAINLSIPAKQVEKWKKEKVGITLAAEYLGISRTLLGKWCNDGTAPKYHVIDNKRWFLFVDLEAYKMAMQEKVAA